MLHCVSLMACPYSCYHSVSEWVDAASKTQEEAEPIKSELDAVQDQLETHKVLIIL